MVPLRFLRSWFLLLVKKISAVKIKSFKLINLFLLFLALGLSILIYCLLSSSSIISPLSRQTLDLTPRLQEKVSLSPPLDFTQMEKVSSLDDVPRYLVYNADTLRVYAAKNHDQKMAPASFTKLLTTQVVLDLLSPDQFLTTTQSSVNRVPTVLGLKVGEQLTVRELIRASVTTSANDAAATLAEGTASLLGLYPSDFIDLMNFKAQLLEMENSHFSTPDGLDDDNQYSTLIDISKLIHNVQKNYSEILSAASSDRQDIQANEYHGHYYLSNWNGLLGVYPGVDGLKIAYTGDAGYSTIVTAKLHGFSLVAIVSGADSIAERDLAAADLLDVALIAENHSPINMTKSRLQPRYNQWQELIDKTRRELEALENQD